LTGGGGLSEVQIKVPLLRKEIPEEAHWKEFSLVIKGEIRRGTPVQLNEGGEWKKLKREVSRKVGGIVGRTISEKGGRSDHIT